MQMMKTHKLASGFRGTFEGSITAGNGVPYADPRLVVIRQEGFAPEGLDIVSNVSIAVGVNADGFLQPCDGVIPPYGILDRELLGTACMYDNVEPGKFNNIPSLTNGAWTNTETLHQLQPTVFQQHVLFEAGLSFKTAGPSAKLFTLREGDLLRPIAKEEIDTCITDETLPVLFGEAKEACPKTKAFYAGKLVKFGESIAEVTPAKANDYCMKCARVGGFRDPAQYDNYAYQGHWVFDYDLQGPSTHGNARGVWNTISSTYGNAEYTVKIVDFYATM